VIQRSLQRLLSGHVTSSFHLLLRSPTYEKRHVKRGGPVWTVSFIKLQLSYLGSGFSRGLGFSCHSSLQVLRQTHVFTVNKSRMEMLHFVPHSLQRSFLLTLLRVAPGLPILGWDLPGLPEEARCEIWNHCT
jgi:hypothetical protein